MRLNLFSPHYSSAELQRIIVSGDSEGCKKALQDGLNPNRVLNDKVSLLRLAVTQNQPTIIALLVEYGAWLDNFNLQVIKDHKRVYGECLHLGFKAKKKRILQKKSTLHENKDDCFKAIVDNIYFENKVLPEFVPALKKLFNNLFFTPIFECAARACRDGHIRAFKQGIVQPVKFNKRLRLIGSTYQDVQQLTTAWPEAVGKYNQQHTIYFTGKTAEDQVLTILHEMIHFTCQQVDFHFNPDSKKLLQEIDKAQHFKWHKSVRQCLYEITQCLNQYLPIAISEELLARGSTLVVKVMDHHPRDYSTLLSQYFPLLNKGLCDLIELARQPCISQCQF